MCHVPTWYTPSPHNFQKLEIPRMKAAIKRASEKGTKSSKVVKRARQSAKQKERAKTYSQLTSAAFGIGFPRRLKITHKYAENFTLTNTAGAGAYYNFSCNGLYDPNISGTGHQPAYFDNLAAIYNHYTVIASRIRIRATTASTQSVPVNVACFINDDTSVTGGFLAALEQPSSQSQFLQVNAGAAPAELYLSWSAKATFGGSILGNDNLQGGSGNNPSEQSYFTIMTGPSDSTTATITYFLVEIEYVAVWDELKDFASN